jgi:hypothetical protein
MEVCDCKMPVEAYLGRGGIFGCSAAEVSIAAGAFLFRKVPATLDVYHPTGMLGFFALQAYLFLNLHHYFIDNAIWRHTNPEIRALITGDTCIDRSRAQT